MIELLERGGRRPDGAGGRAAFGAWKRHFCIGADLGAIAPREPANLRWATACAA